MSNQHVSLRSRQWSANARPPPILMSVVQNGSDLRIGDVRLVVPVEAGVDRLGLGLAIDGLHGGVNHRGTHAYRVLGDRAGHQTGRDGVLLSLAGVEANDGQTGLVELLDTLDDTDGRALVRAEDALEIRVGLDDRLGD